MGGMRLFHDHGEDARIECMDPARPIVLAFLVLVGVNQNSFDEIGLLRKDGGPFPVEFFHRIDRPDRGSFVNLFREPRDIDIGEEEDVG